MSQSVRRVATRTDEENINKDPLGRRNSSGKDEFGLESARSRLLFDILAEAFAHDHMRRRYSPEESGWRSLPQLASRIRVPPSTLYARQGGVGNDLGELVRRGLSEIRTVSGKQGRGGEVLRVRLAYDREPVGEFLRARMANPTAAELHHRIFLPRNRLAVLPFVNIGPDQTDEYIADGLTEELIGKLSQIKGFEVIARTSVMAFKNEKKTAEEIGTKLRAGTLIEGSVRKAGKKLRISIQLVDANTSGHVWSTTYDRNVEDIFAIQAEIARQVSKSLRVRLLPSEKRRLEEKPTGSSEAHILYLKGRYHWNERTPKSVNTAAEYFQKAISKDPSFALAYSGLADAYVVMGDLGGIRPLEAGQKIRSLAEKALELDPTLAEAHAALGTSFTLFFWDWRRAEVEFKRSIELNPAYPTARQWYGKYLSITGRIEEAIVQIKTALRLDPFSLIINVNYGEALIEGGRYREGINQALKTIALDPAFVEGHFDLGQYYVHGSQFVKAVEEFRKALEIFPGFSWALASLGHVYGLMHRKEEATKILSEMKELSSTSYFPPALIALVEFSLGRKAEAFRHLDEAYKEHSHWLLQFRVFPGFDDIRADERFARFVKKMGLER